MMKLDRSREVDIPKLRNRLEYDIAIIKKEQKNKEKKIKLELGVIISMLVLGICGFCLGIEIISCLSLLTSSFIFINSLNKISKYMLLKDKLNKYNNFNDNLAILSYNQILIITKVMGIDIDLSKYISENKKDQYVNKNNFIKPIKHGNKENKQRLVLINKQK